MSDVMGKRQRKVGEFPIPPSGKSLPVKEPIEAPEVDDADIELTTDKEAKSVAVEEFDGIQITDSDREAYLEAILFEKEYTETIDLFDGKLKCTLRTRWFK